MRKAGLYPRGHARIPPPARRGGTPSALTRGSPVGYLAPMGTTTIAAWRRAAPLAAAAGLACALAAGGAGATLYKWTDASGRVVYSDQPPTGNVKVEIVGGAPPPDNPNAVRDMANREAEAKKAQRERAEEAAKVDQGRADAIRRAEICDQARAAVRMYQGTVPIYRLSEKGERVLVSDDERRRKLEEQQRLANEYCAGRAQ